MPPIQVGQASTSWPLALKTISAFLMTLPVAPSMALITFCVAVGRAQELAGGPVEGVDHAGLAGNAGQDAGVSPGASRGSIQLTAVGSGATAVSTRMRSKG